MIPQLTSVKAIEQQYRTGEEPVLVVCSDRNANNANLLYDVINRRLVSIDYGCIMNTATFEYPLSQLTSTDTILNSDLFLHLARYRKRIPTASILTDLKPDYEKCLLRSAGQTAAILESIPKEWNLPLTLVEEKLRQFLDAEWQKEVWSNFVECLNENMPYE